MADKSALNDPTNHSRAFSKVVGTSRHIFEEKKFLKKFSPKSAPKIPIKREKNAFSADFGPFRPILAHILAGEETLGKSRNSKKKVF